MEKCHFCQTTERALRPYGPGRVPICFECVRSDPERHAIARMYAREAKQRANGFTPTTESTVDPLDGPLSGLPSVLIAFDMPPDMPLSALLKPCPCPVCTREREREAKCQN